MCSSKNFLKYSLLQMPDLCSMLRPSTYDDTACVNAAIEINVLDYIVTMCNVNGAYPGTYEPHTDG